MSYVVNAALLAPVHRLVLRAQDLFCEAFRDARSNMAADVGCDESRNQCAQESDQRPSCCPHSPSSHRRPPVIRFSGMPLLAVASLLVVQACGSVGETHGVASSSVPASQAAPANYAELLSRHGLGVGIPSRGKFILVNIPSFELIALQDGAPILRSRVIVGRPVTPTPELQSSMFAVKFNPSWMPTAAMMRYEGARYAPPGPNNPLGLILFELDNSQLIFLHDTNDKTLFDRPQRALSHGCVRVERARSLAAWVLGVSEGEIDSMIAVGATHSIPLPENITVSIVYGTSLPDEDGKGVTYPDVYARQPTVAQADREY